MEYYTTEQPEELKEQSLKLLEEYKEGVESNMCTVELLEDELFLCYDNDEVYIENNDMLTSSSLQLIYNNDEYGSLDEYFEEAERQINDNFEQKINYQILKEEEERKGGIYND